MKPILAVAIGALIVLIIIGLFFYYLANAHVMYFPDL